MNNVVAVDLSIFSSGPVMYSSNNPCALGSGISVTISTIIDKGAGHSASTGERGKPQRLGELFLPVNSKISTGYVRSETPAASDSADSAKV